MLYVLECFDHVFKILLYATLTLNLFELQSILEMIGLIINLFHQISRLFNHLRLDFELSVLELKLLLWAKVDGAIRKELIFDLNIFFLFLLYLHFLSGHSGVGLVIVVGKHIQIFLIIDAFADLLFLFISVILDVGDFLFIFLWVWCFVLIFGEEGHSIFELHFDWFARRRFLSDSMGWDICYRRSIADLGGGGSFEIWVFDESWH